jgi:molecular chaperone GrpE
MAKPQSTQEEAATNEAGDIASLAAENAALRDRYLRALADADNTRRRAERAADEARQYAITDIAREFLQIADNLQRALAAAKSGADVSPTDASLLEGVRATQRMLARALERFGIRKIDALGAQFDPALHEAVMGVDTDKGEPGVITEVLEEGYTIKDRLLRPARVVVVRGPPAQTSPAQAPPAA